MPGEQDDPYVLDSDVEDNARPARSTHTVRDIVDLTQSTPPSPRLLLTQASLRPRSTSTKGQSSLDSLPSRLAVIAPKVSPSGTPSHSSTPPGASRGSPILFKNASRASISTPGPLIKTSPHSSSKGVLVIPQDRGKLVSSLLSDEEEEEEDEDEEFEDNEDLTLAPGTPSKLSPRGRQIHQKEESQTSIGTSSPLVTRLKERRSRSRNVHSEIKTRDASPREEMWRRSLSNYKENNDQEDPIARIEECLQNLEDTMREDCALTVRYLLQDAKNAVENSTLPFIDESSPFASKESVFVQPGGMSLPQGCVSIKMESYGNKSKNKAGKKVSFIAKRMMDDTPQVPKYSSHTSVKRNILTMDEERLKYIPYMGDAEASKKKNARLITELEAAYTPKASPSSRDSEWSSLIRAYLDTWLEELDLGIDQDKLIQYLLENSTEDLGTNSEEAQTILDSYGSQLGDQEKGIAKSFCQSFLKFYRHSLKNILLPEERKKELAERVRKANREKKTPTKSQIGEEIANNSDTPSPERLGTYTSLTCLICGAVSCQTHGDSGREEKDPGYYQYFHQPLVTTYQDILRKQDARVAAVASSSPAALECETELEEDHQDCSKECYRSYRYDGLEYSLDVPDISKIESMVISLRDEKRRPCTISFFLNIPCWQVHCEIQQTEPRSVEPPPMGRRKVLDWYNNQKKTLRPGWEEHTKAHLHQERTQASPCSHEGECRKGCPCFESDILCESICGCADECARKFTGCACHGRGITCCSDSCICFQMNRECGPQCTSCGAIPRIDPANRYDDDLFATGCQNIHLQRGVSRKMILGESQLDGVGFGLYLGEPVQKGDFLSEYAGEVISFFEADRRGIIYDRKFLSFLFDLNSEWTIDAARLGNKTRFINHADNDKDGLNCEAKIVIVNGEHRIKFLALRDIKVGEELLFNYGKKFADKHGLNKKLPKAKEGSKRGVVVGEAALEALDGLNPARAATRGKMTAIRGGHGGGRGRPGKARKSAGSPILAPEVATEEETTVESEHMDVDGDEIFLPQDEDEDVDFEDGTVGRRKRKIIKPLKYTR